MNAIAAATAALFRMYRWSASRQRLVCTTAAPASMPGPRASERATISVCCGSTMLTALGGGGRRVADPWVEDAVHDVGDHVRDDDDHREQHGQAHHDGVVLPGDRRHVVLADARDR